MLLELVWHNPDPPVRVARQVRRVQGDQDAAVYEVSNQFRSEEFKVMRGSAASESRLKPTGRKRARHSEDRTPHVAGVQPPLK